MKDACTETTAANESPFVRNVQNMQNEGRFGKYKNYYINVIGI